MGWKEKNACRGAPPGARVLHWEFFIEQKRRGGNVMIIGVLIMDITPLKQSRCVSRQGSSGMNTNPIPCRMSCNTG